MPAPAAYPTNPAYDVCRTHWDANRDGRPDLAVDILAPAGTEAIAVFDGIASAYWTAQGGHTVTIRAGDGWRAHYGHLRDVSVPDGAYVAAGQVIGHTGSTGTLSSGPHLHFAIGTSISPDVGEGSLLACDWYAQPGASGGPAGQGIPWGLVAVGVAAVLLLDEL